MLKALVLTILIELAALFLLNKFWLKNRIKQEKIFVAGVLASSITLPFLWLILPLFLKGELFMPVGEMLVTVAEAVLYSLMLKMKPYEALVASAICNAASYFIGGFVLYNMGV
ncbi:MAG: hypothetical protein QW035_02485 [Candidatus Anstonellales archaeon]